MDIEGAEVEALKGAKKTIIRFRPRMAISCYHRPEHEEVIPNLILSFNQDYRYKIVKRENGESIAYFW